MGVIKSSISKNVCTSKPAGNTNQALESKDLQMTIPQIMDIEVFLCSGKLKRLCLVVDKWILNILWSLLAVQELGKTIKKWTCLCMLLHPPVN